MNVRKKFNEEVCSTCDSSEMCNKTIDNQARCATLATYFNVEKIMKSTTYK